MLNKDYRKMMTQKLLALKRRMLILNDESCISNPIKQHEHIDFVEKPILLMILGSKTTYMGGRDRDREKTILEIGGPGQMSFCSNFVVI